MSQTSELADYRDKTMAQWFADPEKKDSLTSMRNEYRFYKLRGLDFSVKEKQITLQPGQLLILDNMRVVHGRIGKRNMEEIYQFMYGVKAVEPAEINSFRRDLVKELISS